MNLKILRFHHFVLVSALLHGLVGTWYYSRSDKPPVIAKPNNKLTISEGLQAAIAGANLVTPEPIVEPPPIQQPVVQPENLVPTSKRIKKKEIEKKVIEKKVVERKPIQKKPVQKKVVEKKPIKPVQQPIKKTVVKPAPEHKATTIVGAQGTDGSKNQASKQKETGSGNQVGGSNNEAQFDFFVRQHLLAKKITPKTLRSRNKKGVVVVEFTIDRNGKLLTHKITKSSKIPEFDRAAIKLLRNAEPYPKAPNYTAWSTRKYSIDISYSVR